MAKVIALWISSSDHERSRGIVNAPFSARSATESALRAVAMTLSPLARAASTVSWAKP